MSLKIPSLRPKEEKLGQALEPHGEYGVASLMHTGLSSSVKDQANPSTHPLQYSLEHWREQQERQAMATARAIQGLHMPMKLGMERFAAKQINRLPCMATRNSNLMEDILTGRDESIDIEDVFNSPMEFPERAGDPHALMERRLGIL
ncbi:proteasome maturation protein-like isoform X2 [Watersipora subatra]|uniref:proteasome maturation protein-like isoform X2 n=1 Tax=Watersipora subatra TaxID=2589382 RepID=UPI00355B8FD3